MQRHSVARSVGAGTWRAGALIVEEFERTRPHREIVTPDVDRGVVRYLATLQWTLDTRAARAFRERNPGWLKRQLAWGLDTFQYRQWHRHDQAVTWQAAVTAALERYRPAIVQERPEERQRAELLCGDRIEKPVVDQDRSDGALTVLWVTCIWMHQSPPPLVCPSNLG